MELFLADTENTADKYTGKSFKKSKKIVFLGVGTDNSSLKFNYTAQELNIFGNLTRMKDFPGSFGTCRFKAKLLFLSGGYIQSR
jgi:hypothetical protein